MNEAVRHKDVGRYRFSLFALPEGDHHRWQVTRIDLGSDTIDHFGRQLAGGTARNESEAWKLAETWLDEYLKNHPSGG